MTAKHIRPFVAFIFVCLGLSFRGVASFSLVKFRAARSQRPTATINLLQAPQQLFDEESSLQVASSLVESTSYFDQSPVILFLSVMMNAPLCAFAATDDLELTELPPVYVPILFAIGVLGGVGVLTASLGNVMDEEASLGLQSGARAKKEQDRNRSSYFKK